LRFIFCQNTDEKKKKNKKNKQKHKQLERT